MGKVLQFAGSELQRARDSPAVSTLNPRRLSTSPKTARSATSKHRASASRAATQKTALLAASQRARTQIRSRREDRVLCRHRNARGGSLFSDAKDRAL